ncbi:MAG: hypothetical protein ACRCXE_01685 [Metamycoplasmataceae bacterium]
MKKVKELKNQSYSNNQDIMWENNKELLRDHLINTYGFLLEIFSSLKALDDLHYKYHNQLSEKTKIYANMFFNAEKRIIVNTFIIIIREWNDFYNKKINECDKKELLSPDFKWLNGVLCKEIKDSLSLPMHNYNKENWRKDFDKNFEELKLVNLLINDFSFDDVKSEIEKIINKLSNGKYPQISICNDSTMGAERFRMIEILLKESQKPKTKWK